MQHDAFAPSFLVDVTSTWDQKIAALTHYRSQLAVPGDEATGEGAAGREASVTKISTREFWLAVEGRARHFGELIGAPLAEPFWSRLPLAVTDLLAILPGGVR
jgi:LmbE family N-acetylglucosaminyl deacetylase